MSKTYRGWAEVDDWSSGREFRRPSKRKSELAWKNEFNKEQNVSQPQVFVIINEWTDKNGGVSSEVTAGKYFLSEDEAWTALDLIAEATGVDLSGDDTSFVLEHKDSGLHTEEYRIEELTR